MKLKNIRIACTILAIVLLVAYLVLSSIPCLDKDENQIYFKVLFSLSFFSIIIRNLIDLKHEKDN